MNRILAPLRESNTRNMMPPPTMKPRPASTGSSQVQGHSDVIPRYLQQQSMNLSPAMAPQPVMYSPQQQMYSPQNMQQPQMYSPQNVQNMQPMYAPMPQQMVQYVPQMVSPQFQQPMQQVRPVRYVDLDDPFSVSDDDQGV